MLFFSLSSSPYCFRTLFVGSNVGSSATRFFAFVSAARAALSESMICSSVRGLTSLVTFTPRTILEIPPDFVANASQIWSGEIAEAFLWHSSVGEPDFNSLADTRVGSQASVDVANKIGNSRPYAVVSATTIYRIGNGSSSSYSSGAASGYLYITEGVTSIADAQFYQRTNIKRIFLPSTVSTIGTAAFRLISSLLSSSFVVPPSTLRAYSFENLQAKGVIFLPKEVTLLDGYSLNNMKVDHMVFEKATANDAANSRDQSCHTCTSLKSVNVSNRFSYLHKTFSRCTAIQRFTSLQPFTCNNLFEFVTTWSTYFSTGATFPAGLYVKTGSTITFVAGTEYDYILVSPSGAVSQYLPGDAGIVVIGSSVTSIPADKFSGNNSLTGVDFSLATSLTTVGSSCFDACGQLVDVVFPTYITVTFGLECFRNTKAAQHLFVPKNMIMGSYAIFSGSACLTAVFQKASVEQTLSIPRNSFANNPNLTYVDVGNRFNDYSTDVFSSCSLLKTFVSHRSFTITSSTFTGTPLATYLPAGTYSAGIYEVDDSNVYTYTPFPGPSIGATGTTTVTI